MTPRYAARAPVAFERLQYDPRKQQVVLVSDKTDGPTAGTHTLDALEFSARLLTRVPNKNEICVRYYGAYSVRRRHRWRKQGLLRDRQQPGDANATPPRDDAIPTWPALRALRRRWAELLARVFEVDPLRCRRCGGSMRIIDEKSAGDAWTHVQTFFAAKLKTE